MAKSRKKQMIEEPQEIAEVKLQPITETIEKNYMPYVMTSIISRAIPAIDGFKPSHRKLLYTMYKMGLLTGQRTKSANVVGQTMRLNPHGDMAIYETMVRLTRGNETLLHPFVDSKGSFGKQYSTMAFAASRYTEVKLDKFCAEIFSGIDKNAVDFIDNYDSTMREPTILPTTFPNILVSPNSGVAVGIACEIASFNLAEICDGTIAALRNPEITSEELSELIKAPDFASGASILYNKEDIISIYETGRGSVNMRSRYVYDKESNCIDVLEIPFGVTIEQIIAKITDLIKRGELKEVTDVRDEIDLHGFKLTLDLRRGADPEKVMAKLFKKTPLESSYACNFNVIVDNEARQLGVREMLLEWIKFRMSCYRRELIFERDKKSEKLHLLVGLGTILLDLDKAIKIVRETARDKDVIPNLMAGFKIDEVQAEYIAEIKLRNFNREYIIERIKEIESLKKEIAELSAVIDSDAKIKRRIIKQLEEIKEKYGIPRKTMIVYEDTLPKYDAESFIENYNVKLVLTEESYFKKITLQSLRGNDEQKLKEGDSVLETLDAENVSQLMCIGTLGNMYRAKVSDFSNCKASEFGDYLPAKLKCDGDEKIKLIRTDVDYESGDNLVFVFENGKAVRIPISAYATKAPRKKLVKAFNTNSPLVGAFYEEAGKSFDIFMKSGSKGITVSSKLIPQKTSRTSAGVQIFTLKGGQKLELATVNLEKYPESASCRKIKVPATGVTL